MTSIKQQLIKLLRASNYSYDELHSDADIELVYNMFKNDKPIEINDSEIDNYDSAVLTYLGYYYSTKNDSDNMMKYYHIAIGKGNPDAMINIGYNYMKEKDYENMMKYYLMAVEHDDSDALLCIGQYYEQQHDSDNAVKHYLMAVEKGNMIAHDHLAHYYVVKNDFENAVNHYMITYNGNTGIDDTENEHPFYIGYCYHKLEKFDLMEKYLLIFLNEHIILNYDGDDNDNIKYIILSFHMLIEYYENNMSDEFIKLLTEFIFKNNKYCKILSPLYAEPILRNKVISYMKSRSPPLTVYENECPLCLNNIIDSKIILKCGHVYCEQCLLDFVSNDGGNNTKCCICKAPVS